MSRSPRRTPGLALALAALAAPALAHEDDPKVRDRRPAYPGPGWTARASAGGGGLAATSFEAQGVTLLAWMPLADFGSPASGSDCWGYVSPSGREYALFCHSEGTAVVEVTDPSAPVLVGQIAGPASLWRDVKTYGTYAYAVSEGGGGIQVIDLSGVDAGVVSLAGTVSGGGLTTATHNVAIDETSGFLYRAGGGDHGLRVYDLANPASPQLVAQWNDRYVHDVQVVTFTSGPHAGRQVAFACSGFNGGWTDTGVSVIDVTDKSDLRHVGQVSWPGADYSHQAWLSDDGTLLYVNDEVDENGSFPTTTYVLDVSVLESPAYLGSFTNGLEAVGHNLYVDGTRIYEANYRSGLRIFDAAADPVAPVETAWFDTDPDGDGATFNGAWSTYPFFPSGTVLVSDLERGLFVLWPHEAPVTFAFPGGAPTLLDPAGDAITVQLDGAWDPGTAELHYDAGAGWQTLDLVDLGGGTHQATLPALPCGASVAYRVTAEAAGAAWVDPPGGGAHEASVATSETLVSAWDMETAAGWSVGAPDDASTGSWVRGNPIGTAAQPEDDHSAVGTRCWFTGQGSPGGDLGEADVDGGSTTLLSPVLDLSSTVEARVSYWRWYSNTAGASPGADVFVVEASSDGGATWSPVETVGPSGEGTSGGWIRHRFRVADVVEPTATVRLRFVASDLGDGSIVEAALDDVEVRALGCPDCDGDARSDELELADGDELDLDGEGTPDVCQPLSADVGTVSALAGGAQSFTLAAGAAHGGDLYLLLGSTTGTQPGFDVGPVHVPLVQDVWFGFTLASPNHAPLVGTLGTLDAQGGGSAALVLGGGLGGLVGLTVHHAYVVVDAATGGVTFASNAIPVLLGP